MEPSAEFVREFTRSQRFLHTFILSMVWNPAEAEDVLQETNLAIWRKAAEFDESRQFLPWAMRFAQLQVMAWQKKRQRQRVFLSERFISVLADEVVAGQDVLEKRLITLADCLRKLDSEQRSLICRRYEPGGSVRALAAENRIPSKTMSARLRRIRLALLSCIERSLGKVATT